MTEPVPYTEASIVDVARAITSQFDEPISTMKLHKLCFFAQGWCLTWTNGYRLFEEDFRAYSSGPVCPALLEISRDEYEVSPDFFKHMGAGEVEQWRTDIIAAVIGPYRHMSGPQLSVLSQRLGSPWSRTELGEIIEEAEIRRWFDALAVLAGD